MPKKLEWVNVIHFHREIELDDDEVAELEKLDYDERVKRMQSIIGDAEHDAAYTETYIGGPGVEAMKLTSKEPYGASSEVYFVEE